jgi:hypothetical protein
VNLPPFFNEVPRLRTRDPLADLLGSAEGGIFDYSYADAVRLTGHSCPTVAAAYWLTWRALHTLFPDSLPVRGGVRVEFRDHARIGSTGTVANVVQMLTGASGSSGFKGIGGRFARAGLLRYAPGLPLSLRFTRLDNGAAVDAAADLTLAQDDDIAPLMACCIDGSATEDQIARLGRMWQDQVRRLLLQLAYDPGVFVVREVVRRRAAMVPAGALIDRRD